MVGVDAGNPNGLARQNDRIELRWLVLRELSGASYACANWKSERMLWLENVDNMTTLRMACQNTHTTAQHCTIQLCVVFVPPMSEILVNVLCLVWRTICSYVVECGHAVAEAVLRRCQWQYVS